ncbi:unnamed protein product [Mucor circinelloides]
MKRSVEKCNAMSMIKAFGHILDDNALSLLYKTANANGHMGNLPASTAFNTLDFPPIAADFYDKKRPFYSLSSFSIPNVTGSEEIPTAHGALKTSSSEIGRSHSEFILDKQTFDCLVEHYQCAYEGAFQVVAAGSALEGRGLNTAVVRNKVIKMALYAIEGLVYRSLWKGSCTGAYIQAHFQGSHGSLVGLYPGAEIFFRSFVAFAKWYFKSTSFRILPLVQKASIHVKDAERHQKHGRGLGKTMKKD